MGNLPDRIRGAVTSARAREIMGVMTLDRLNPPLLSSSEGLLLFAWPLLLSFRFWDRLNPPLLSYFDGLSWYLPGLSPLVFGLPQFF